MTRQQQVIERLQTFVFDQKSMTELKNFDVSQPEKAQAFIIQVQKLMHKSRHWAFNDWNYGDYIVIGELIAEFSRWLLKWYLPPKESPVENQQWPILLMGILIAVSGIYRQSNFRATVWSGIDEVDKLLLGVNSSPEMACWWEKRIQKEIIDMFRRAQLQVQELEKLASQSSSQRPFSRAVEQLLPQFDINIHKMASSIKWIMRGTALVFLYAEYPFLASFFDGTGRLSNSNFMAVGVFMVLFIQGKKSAAVAEYGGERAIRWESHKMQGLLKHLQKNPDNDEKKPVTWKKMGKQTTIMKKIKLARLASAKKQQNDKKKTCKKALINTAALLYNMAAAFPGFCLNTMQALFAQSCHRQRTIIPDKKSKKPEQVVVRKNFPTMTKKPAGSWRTPAKSESSLSAVSSTETAALNEESKTPARNDNFLQGEPSCSARTDDERIEPDLPLPSGVSSVEEIKTMETPSAPLPDNQFRVLEVTIPEFFGGQTFEVKMTNANASEWDAMNFSTAEQLAILKTTHKLVCDRATRNFIETAELRHQIKELKQKKETETVFFQGMMTPHSPDQPVVRGEQPQQQLPGNGI
jgi:hypothetical protein